MESAPGGFAPGRAAGEWIWCQRLSLLQPSGLPAEKTAFRGVATEFAGGLEDRAFLLALALLNGGEVQPELAHFIEKLSAYR